MQKIKLNVTTDCTTYLYKYTAQQYLNSTIAYYDIVQKYSKRIKCVYVIKQYDDCDDCIARSSSLVVKLNSNALAVITHNLTTNTFTCKQANFTQCITALFTLNDLT